MSSDIVVKNPWGRGKVSLKGRTLTNNEKSYLAQLVNLKGKTCQEVADTYSLSKSVIVKYSKSARNGLILHTGSGQPPAIDNISSDALVNFLSNNNDNVNIKDRKDFVLNACQESYNRRFNVAISNRKAFKVSGKTIKKYTDDFISKSCNKA
jgi:transposase